MHAHLQRHISGSHSVQVDNDIPKEGNRGRRRDTTPIDIPSCPGNNAPHCQPDNDGDVLEERGSEEFGEDDRDER